jgi:ribosome-associated protein
MKSHGAVRRQAMWIGKLIRMEDSDAIMQAYQHLHEEESAKTQGFHQVEEWRTRLMQDGKEALTLFINAYPDVDVQQLRHLIKKAIEDAQRDAQSGAYRALFRYLRSFVS